MMMYINFKNIWAVYIFRQMAEFEYTAFISELLPTISLKQVSFL